MCMCLYMRLDAMCVSMKINGYLPDGQMNWRVDQFHK
jgi:hypothetical protein